MLNTIGIHSNAAEGDALTAGHAWLTLHFANGRSTSIGLWTNSLGDARRLISDPTGFLLGETFDVEWGWEDQKGYRPKASRYYRLTEGQARSATSILAASGNWRFTNTCASWATEVVRRLIGEDIPSTELAGATNTPRALGIAIRRLESKNPTSISMPRAARASPVQPPRGSLNKQ